MAAKKFTAGDRVGHSTRIGFQHSDKSVMRKDAIAGMDPEAWFGTVTGPADVPGIEPNMVWAVSRDGDGGTMHCTADSLVKIED